MRSPWCLLLAIAFIGCGGDLPNPDSFGVVLDDDLAPPEAPAACKSRDPQGMALFGDLHVHTSLSSDARNYDVLVRPHEAYGYAFGREILLPPNDEYGRGTRRVRIDRPLDFAAVTDHAEFLGENLLCTTPDSEVYETETCTAIRASESPVDSPFVLKIMNPFSSRDADVCGEAGERCAGMADLAWREIINAAEAWNDTSEACERTTLIGYEYSSHRLGSNLHRNVIFRNSRVPRSPISFMEVRRVWQLWELLRETCLESDTGCDVLAIPHNSNISNGRMFSIDYPGASSHEAQVARARLRAALEPAVEIMQHKGDSECRNGLSAILGNADEFCDFEKFEDMAFARAGDEPPGECWDGPLADWVPHFGPDCLSYRSYVRYALVEGLAEQERLGVNPFKLGLIASTDTHNGLAGGVEERNWPGHVGVADAEPERRLSATPGVMGNVANGPGGLVGVWAEENSRDAIFRAIRRREIFGTSGPRIRPRFFAGWDYPEDLCGRRDWLSLAAAGGVPMGSDLPALPASEHGAAAPHFVVFAARDPGTEPAPGGLLQRIQIIKGWVDAEGGLHQELVDVVGGPNTARVDPETCAPLGPGADQLCGVWRDPDFDPSRSAVYYARVLENPSCRYSAWQCLALAPDERPEDCDAPFMDPVQQERAWTSPIWFTPARGRVNAQRADARPASGR